MYRKAHAASAALFAQYRDLGNATINKHLLQIMALLLPMRRVCSGESGHKTQTLQQILGDRLEGLK